MTSPGIFLEHNGPVDFPVVNSILMKLRETKEFMQLDTTTRKRTYSLFVECLENICKHSALKMSDDKKLQPHFSARNEADKIVIIAGNPVNEESRDKLAKRLDKINKLDVAALRKMHEVRISIDQARGENGAGLGFICMAFKSGNKIIYNFRPLISGYLYFEIQISLNKHIMRKLLIDQTSYSPKVILDPEKKIYEISGESRPPDVREFYDQILNWMDDFSIQLIKTGDKTEPVEFIFNFGYFNSSSGKLILDLCKVLARLQAKGMNVSIKWYYEKDDVDMLEVGHEISRIVKFPFEYVETEPK
jgi:hypothetical protein